MLSLCGLSIIVAFLVKMVNLRSKSYTILSLESCGQACNYLKGKIVNFKVSVVFKEKVIVGETYILPVSLWCSN